MTTFKLHALCGVSAAALLLAAAAPAPAQEGRFANGSGRYQSGDFHNHTTCSDGSTAVRTLTGRSLEYLDWFISGDHSGTGSRDCRFDDPTQSGLGGPNITRWADTIGNSAILGLQSNGQPQSATGNMWRWQALDQFQYPDIAAEGADRGKPAFTGLEWVVPAHEHTSTSIIGDQFADPGNARAIAQFEYCFAVNSNDTSRGFERDWSCEISAENNQALIDRFTGDPVNQFGQGAVDYNASLPVDPNGILGPNVRIADNGDHVKSTAAVYWMQENYPGQSYAVQAHIERAGPFRTGENRGYNIEHIRNWNNAAPDVAFGFESQPGHQASDTRGEYQPDRSGGTVASVGLFTYGGTGCYAGAEAARPGFKFDGTALTSADFAAGGEFEVVPDGVIPQFVTVCRPGVRTAWDAMLSEGRRFWFFASSDWHNRGSFAFDDRRSTFDFAPGEYQKTHAFIRTRNPDNPAQDIVDGLRSGNLYATMGDLIDQLEFRACVGSKCATMGETLTVPAGSDVQISIRFRDPTGKNLSPYSFPNPALQQIGISEPLDQPTVKHVDIITGDVTGLIENTNTAGDEYRNPLAPETTVLAASFTADGAKKWAGRGPTKRITWTLEDVTTNKYVRIRGSNMPAGTPNERDASGNPLRDDLGTNNIACTDPACPPHVSGRFDFDVEGWGDLWFYANPIFIEIEGATTASN